MKKSALDLLAEANEDLRSAMSEAQKQAMALKKVKRIAAFGLYVTYMIGVTYMILMWLEP